MSGFDTPSLFNVQSFIMDLVRQNCNTGFCSRIFLTLPPCLPQRNHFIPPTKCLQLSHILSLSLHVSAWTGAKCQRHSLVEIESFHTLLHIFLYILYFLTHLQQDLETSQLVKARKTEIYAKGWICQFQIKRIDLDPQTRKKSLL